MSSNPKIVYRGPDTLFYNSQCLFVEYHDVIASPWFSMLLVAMQYDKMRQVFDFSELDGKDPAAIYDWYIRRKHRNVFRSLPFIGQGTQPTDEELDSFLYDNELASEEFYRTELDGESMTLNFYDITKRLAFIDKKLVKKICFYSEHENQFIRDVVESEFTGTNASYVFGPFEEILNTIPKDSTFVLSDFRKVVTMKETDHLAYTSIMVCDGYGYNDPSIFPVEEVEKTIPFKFSYFNGLFQTESEADDPSNMSFEDLKNFF